MEIRNTAGDIVTAGELWDGIFEKLSFVMDNMKDPDSGLLFHGYCVNEKATNGIVWGRGMGWYS